MPVGKRIACVGDGSDHNGTIINSGGNTSVLTAGVLVAVNGASHSCPIHGVTQITAITTKSFVNSVIVPAGGKNLTGSALLGDMTFGGSNGDSSYVASGRLIVTYGATAGCGAVITPPDRKVYVE